MVPEQKRTLNHAWVKRLNRFCRHKTSIGCIEIPYIQSWNTKLELYRSNVLSRVSVLLSMDQIECWRMTEKNCLPSTPRTLQESCEYSGPRPSAKKFLSPAATKTAWATSSGEGDEDRSDLWREERQTTSLALPLWTPEGKQKPGRPKNTWCQTVEGEFKILHHTWRAILRLAQNRHGTLCAALHANWHNKHEWERLGEWYK